MKKLSVYIPCLLYTSDAADDSLRVDLGGRRIIKKIDFFQAENGILERSPSRGLRDVYKRQKLDSATQMATLSWLSKGRQIHPKQYLRDHGHPVF